MKFFSNPDMAAVILCAGKGSRMNDDSKNKVCFDCAGIPVLRRIVSNMREGGVRRFVLVVGHNAQSVMDCMAEDRDIAYAYQKEQKGTDHAAECGLKVLKTMGFSGHAIIAMGDKIVAPKVIAGLVGESENADVIWGGSPWRTIGTAVGLWLRTDSLTALSSGRMSLIILWLVSPNQNGRGLFHP